MKTSYSIHIIPAVLLALSACTNDSLSPENGSEPAHLRATFDADVAVTKSILIDNPGVKLESFWEAGEQIGVFGGNVGNALFTLMAEDLSYDRKTADFTTDGTIPAGSWKRHVSQRGTFFGYSGLVNWISQFWLEESTNAE